MENTVVEIEGGPKWNVWTSMEHIHSSLLSTSRFGKGELQIFKPPPCPIKPPEFEVDDSPINPHETGPVYSIEANDKALFNELSSLRGLYRNETIEHHYSTNGWSTNSTSEGSSTGGNEGSCNGSRNDDSESSSVIDPTDDDTIGFYPGNCYKPHLASSSSVSSRIGIDSSDTPENTSPAEDVKAEKPLLWSAEQLEPKPAEAASPSLVVKKTKPKIRNALLSSLLAKQDSKKLLESLPKDPELTIVLKAPDEFEKPPVHTMRCPAGFEDAYDYMKDGSIDEETKSLISRLKEGSPLPSPTPSPSPIVPVKPIPTFDWGSYNSTLNVNAEPYVPFMASPPFLLNNSDFPPLL